MKIGLVVYSCDPETVWNAFRFGLTALKHDDEVKVFLLGKGVESEKIASPSFPVKETMESFVEFGGKILACGTCLKQRQAEGTELCPISTMADLYELVKESDRVLTF
ncbi:MAG: DsrE family protein [Deltaproteobacteria bacterium]|nr:DsrE family protein [Deltaproteobacteria bacterium]